VTRDRKKRDSEMVKWRKLSARAERTLQFRLVLILLHIAIFWWLCLTLELNVISFAGSKEITKENSFSRCTKFVKNQRHSLNFGNSSLRSSDSSKFLTLIPRFSIHKFHDAGKKQLLCYSVNLLRCHSLKCKNQKNGY
jgi:hypothetical protein